MPDRYELHYELTREDWLSAAEAALRTGDGWKHAHRQYLRNTRQQVLWLAPIIIIIAAFLIGQDEGMRGRYLEGAGMGAALVVFLYFALPRLHALEKLKQEHLHGLQRTDLSALLGTFTVTMDPHGMRIDGPYRQQQLTWVAVRPTEVGADRPEGASILLHHGGNDATIIPRRAFASEDEAKDFFRQAVEWWRAGQGSDAERRARTLAIMNYPCPKCGYNLRGTRGEACPECGEAIRLEGFMQSVPGPSKPL